MNDLDLIIFTIVISACFISFGIATLKEFKKASEEEK
jgi:hypothetical protein